MSQAPEQGRLRAGCSACPHLHGQGVRPHLAPVLHIQRWAQLPSCSWAAPAAPGQCSTRSSAGTKTTSSSSSSWHHHGTSPGWVLGITRQTDQDRLRHPELLFPNWLQSCAKLTNQLLPVSLPSSLLGDGAFFAPYPHLCVPSMRS